MTKRHLAIAILASLSIAACNAPQSQPAVVPTVSVASAPPPTPAPVATAQPSAPETPPPASPPASGNPAACGSDGSNPLLCAKAPELKLERVAGTGPSNLKEARGQVVILAFCATWAEPCKKSLPAYQTIAKEHPGRVALIVLLVDEAQSSSPKAIKEYASNLQVTAPFLWDKEGKVAQAYTIAAMPLTLVVDAAGAVRFVHEGYRDGEVEDLRKEIKNLL
jgi:peroxiredoxin